jgi:hypothetical protein
MAWPPRWLYGEIQIDRLVEAEIVVFGRDLGEAVVALAELEVRGPLHRGDPVEGVLGLLKVFGRFEDRK